MSFKRATYLIVPIILGVISALWTSIGFWFDLKEGLIAFLGLLAASLVQVMPVTANFLQSDRLTPAEAIRLTESLTKQQHYWIGLLTTNIIAFVVVVVSAAVKDRLAAFPIFPGVINVSWEQVFCFVIGFFVSFVLSRVFTLFEGILSLHRLRGELVIETAKRASKSAHSGTGSGSSGGGRQVTLPAGYGDLVETTESNELGEGRN